MFRLAKKTTTTALHVHHSFLYVSLPSLHNYDVKLTGTHDNDVLFLFVNLGAVLQNSTREENRRHLTNEKTCNKSDEVSVEAVLLQFLGDVFAAVAVVFAYALYQRPLDSRAIFFPVFSFSKNRHPGQLHKSFKTQSTRTLSSFDFQWTKILYQNNLKHIAYKVQGFCPLKIKITQFPDGFRLNIS